MKGPSKINVKLGKCKMREMKMMHCKENCGTLYTTTWASYLKYTRLNTIIM
jgi:hypothetical protein